MPLTLQKQLHAISNLISLLVFLAGIKTQKNN